MSHRHGPDLRIRGRTADADQSLRPADPAHRTGDRAAGQPPWPARRGRRDEPVLRGAWSRRHGARPQHRPDARDRGRCRRGADDPLWAGPAGAALFRGLRHRNGRGLCRGRCADGRRGPQRADRAVPWRPSPRRGLEPLHRPDPWRRDLSCEPGREPAARRRDHAGLRAGRLDRHRRPWLWRALGHPETTGVDALGRAACAPDPRWRLRGCGRRHPAAGPSHDRILGDPDPAAWLIDLSVSL
jgi:hypothetical protein